MPEYEVVWRTQLDAIDHESAALKALAIHRNPDSIATVFEVRDVDEDSVVEIDLGETGDV